MFKGTKFCMFMVCLISITNEIKPETSYYGELSKRLLKADNLVKEQSNHADIKKNIRLNNLQEESLKAPAQSNEIPFDFKVKSLPQETCLTFIMGVIPQTTSHKEPVCHSWEELDKLNILSGTQTNAENSLINHLGITTASGLVSGAEMLSEDALNIEQAQKRQAIIQYLLAHPEACKVLKKAFADIKEGEGFYWLYFQEINKQLQQMLNTYYFGILNTLFKKIGVDLNKNATALTLSTGGTKLLGLLLLIPWFQLQFTGHVFEQGWENTKNAANLFEKTKELLKIPFSVGKELLTFEVLRHNPFLNGIKRTVLKTTKEGTLSALSQIPGRSLSLGDQMELAESSLYRSEIGTYYLKPAGILNKLKGTAPLLATLYFDLAYAMQMSGFYGLEKMFHDIITHFHLKMIGIAKITRAFTEIVRVAQEAKLPELTALVEPIREFVESSNPEIRQLIANLATETFDSTAFFSKWGRILATNTSMNEHKCAFIDPLRASGSLDVLFAGAKLIQSTAGQQAQYTLVDFVTDERGPAIVINNSWNVLVETPICNNIALGGDASRFINLTGPNMAGKSTICKGAVQAIKLAQIGIINGNGEIRTKPGQETPISILVHVNETEDVSSRKSTFMAENAKLITIIEKIKNNPETLFVIVEDEPLRGTVKDTAVEKVIEHLKTLFALKNTCGFINTHLEEVCILEKQYPSIINNYFVDIDRTTFERFFTIKKGIPTWWFGPQNAEFRKAYIKHLEEEASMPDRASAVAA